jgi:hypothetical protein
MGRWHGGSRHSSHSFEVLSQPQYCQLHLHRISWQPQPLCSLWPPKAAPAPARRPLFSTTVRLGVTCSLVVLITPHRLKSLSHPPGLSQGLQSRPWALCCEFSVTVLCRKKETGQLLWLHGQGLRSLQGYFPRPWLIGTKSSDRDGCSLLSMFTSFLSYEDRDMTHFVEEKSRDYVT